MKKFYQTVFCAVAMTFGSSLWAGPGGDRDIGDGTLPLSITAPMTLNVYEDAQGLVGHLTQADVNLPLREVIELQDGQVTMLFGEATHGVGLTGILAPMDFTGNIFSRVNPNAVIPVKISR